MSKILIITEGARTEIRLMRKLLNIYGIYDDHEIVSYNTNIYGLYSEMFSDGDPYSIDLLQLLKERESDISKKKIFDERYSDTLLIFDLEPQDVSFEANKIRKMVDFFKESSDMGKLYLNYPMVEAFYHMRSIPDPNYDSYSASITELKNGTYKKRVNEENRDRDYKKFASDRDESNIVIKQNVKKAYDMISKKCDYTVSPDNGEILEKQLVDLETKREVRVLSTCGFYIIDYNYHLIE